MMNILMTGATGWVGSVVAQDLMNAGHRVTGLARTAAKATALAATGADVLPGTLDFDTLRRAAAAADAVIHTAFDHDFSRYAANAEQDRRAIEAMGSGLAGTGKPMIVTSGVALLAPGRIATEHAPPPGPSSGPRQSETAARALRDQGVEASCIRLAPTVHGIGDHGFVPMLIALARRTGVSAFIGDGGNRWPAVHRSDAGKLFRRVLEHGMGEPAWHAVAEEGIAFRQIADAIGTGLGLPVEARPGDHFGWFAMFVGTDMVSSSAHTRAALGWQPEGPGLLADLSDERYFEA
jgi:nucleoside-diphosphate-sugar epimerase